MKKLLILAVVIVILVPFCTIAIKKQIYEKRVEAYLIEEKSYSKDEIKSIKVKWHVAGLPYHAHNKGKVKQFEYYLIDRTNLSAERVKHFE